MKTRTLLCRTAVAGAAAALACTAAAGQAQASAVQPAPLKNFLVKQGMYFTGIDAAAAKAHGYKIVTYPDGDEQSVPVNPDSHLPKGMLLTKAELGGIHADNSTTGSVTGDCGTSWVSAQETSTDHVNMQSGFTVDFAAQFYGWTVDLTDYNGTSHHNSAGNLLLRSSWEGSWTNLYQDRFTSEVVEGGSYAEDLAGDVCYSGSPALYLNVS